MDKSKKQSLATLTNGEKTENTVTQSRNERFRFSHQKFALNERIFIHCFVVFYNSIRVWINKKPDESHHLINRISRELCDVYAVTADRLDKCIKEAKQKADSYDYKLLAAIRDVRNCEQIKLLDNESLCLEMRYRPQKWSCLISHTSTIYLEQKQGVWMPDTYNVDSIANIRFMRFDIERNAEIVFCLKALKRRKFSRIKTYRIIANSVMRPSDINPEGFDNWLQFGSVKIRLKLQWILIQNVFVPRFHNFDAEATKHYNNLFSFLLNRFEKCKNTNELIMCQSHNIGFCKNIEMIGKIKSFDELFDEVNNNSNNPALVPISRMNDLQVRNNMYSSDATRQKEYCINSEWCNIDSFYRHNSQFRFIMAQDHRFFRVPDQLLVPFHFREICRLMATKCVPCFSLMASLAIYVEAYLNKEINRKDAKGSYITSKAALMSSKAGRALVQSYAWLRVSFSVSIFVDKHSNIDTKCPKMLRSFQIYSTVLLWLRNQLEIDDPLLLISLRFKFFNIVLEWIQLFLDIRTLRTQTTSNKPNVSASEPMNIDSRVNSPSQNCEQTENATSEMQCLSLFNCIESEIKPESIVAAKRLQVLFNETNVTALPANNKNAFSNELHSKLLLSKQTIFIIRLHEILKSGMQIKNAMINIPRQMYPSKKLTIAEKQFVQKMDQILHNNLDHKSFYVNFSSENCIRKEFRDVLLSIFALRFYSYLFDIRVHVITTLNSNSIKPFDFKFSVFNAKFFSDNTRIDAIFKHSMNNSSPNIFPKIERLNTSIRKAFDKFYLSDWGVPRFQFDECEKPRLIRRLLTEYEALRHWYNSGKQSEQKFMNIVLGVKCTVNWLCNSTVYFFNENIVPYLASNERSDELNVFKKDLVLWLIKAFCYNLVSTALVIVQKSYDLIRILAKSVRRFAMLTPGWYQILRFHRDFSNETQRVKQQLCFDFDSRIEECLKKTDAIIVSLFRNLYMKLMCDWLEELHFLNNLKFKEDKGTTRLKLFPLHLMLGLPILLHFNNDFRHEFKYINSKLVLFIENMTDKNKQKVYLTLVRMWKEDIDSISAHNPFRCAIWKHQIEKHFKILNTLWRNMNNNAFKKGRLFPSSFQALSSKTK